MLTKDDILNADDQKTMILKVVEWGGEVIISTMSGFARDRFESSLTSKSGIANMDNVRSKLVAAVLVDEKGELIFSQSDIIKLGKKSAIALDKVFDAAQKFNKISQDEVDELAKN